MCGITGWITMDGEKPLATKMQVIEAMLACAERGKHATGVYFETLDKHFIVKMPIQASEFIKGFGMWRDLLRSPICLIHTRLATQGDPKQNTNNHPLADNETGMILVHNGIITNSDDFVMDTITDSWAILEAYFLSKTPGKTSTKALLDGFKKLSGTAACAIYNRGEGVLWLIKSGKPLVTGHKRNTIFFGSTKKIVNKYAVDFMANLPENYMWRVAPAKKRPVRGYSVARKIEPITTFWNKNNIDYWKTWSKTLREAEKA